MKKILFTIFLLCAAVGLFMGNSLVRDKVMSYIANSPFQRMFNRNEPEQIPLEVLNAHIYMSPDSILSITKGWIPYYHRHQRDGEINDVLLFLVKKGVFKEEYNHFFAYLLTKHPQYKESLHSVLPNLNSNESMLIENILKYSDDFHSASFIAPVEHEKIWAEYAITGDEDILKRYISLLYSTDETITQSTKGKVSDLLFKKAKIYAKLYQLIDEVQKYSTGVNVQLQTVFSRLDKFNYKPAHNYFWLGKNYAKSGQNELALTALKAGLFFASDDPYLLRQIGDIYFSQKQYEEALPYFEQAKWSMPDRHLAYIDFKKVEIYRHLGKDELAHRELQKSYERDPDDEYILRELAFSYAKRGNIEAATTYLKEMLAKDPVPENIAAAKHFFEEHHIDYAIANENLLNVLIERQFQKLEKILAQTYAEKSQDIEGIYPIHQKLNELLPHSWDTKERAEYFLAAHEEWVEQHPSSYYANACMGIFYVSYAWQARGSGYANTITPEGRKLFNERLRQAEKFLTKAYTIDPDISIAPYKMMTVAQVHPDRQDTDLEIWFQRAIHADPTDYYIYKLRADYLEPKWGGSMDERFAFARDTFKNAPVNSMAPLILAQAHWAVYEKDNDEKYFQRPEVWSELKAVYKELIKRYPDSMKRHNWFARTACIAGDFDTAKAEFEIIGDRWEQSAWNTHENFVYNKQLAIQKGS